MTKACDAIEKASGKKYPVRPTLKISTPLEMAGVLEKEMSGIFRVFGAKTDEALELCPEDPWLWVERALVLQAEDRYEEALESARHALGMRS